MSLRVDLKCAQEGLVNDISLHRIVRRLIDTFRLPDGRYSLENSEVTTNGSSGYVQLELCLPLDRPVKRGTAVVGGTVRLFLRVLTASAANLMDLRVEVLKGPYEKNGETHYAIDMSLFDSRADTEAVAT